MKTALAAIFAAIAMLMVAGAAAIYWIGGQTIRTQAELLKRRTAIDRLNLTLSTLKDAETGQRGYLLTQDDQYLAPFASAENSIKAELTRLSQSLKSNDRERSDFGKLVELASEKLSGLRETVNLARQGNLSQALQNMRSGKGEELMDQIRDLVSSIERQEQLSAQRAQHAVARAARARDAVFWTVAGVSVLFIFGAYRVISRESRLRADALAETERQKDLLRVTLLSIGDGVIITDIAGRIILMNKVAEELTGWDHGEADSMPCETVFRIINEESRQSVERPVAKVLREGTIAGLANHTLLVRRDGTTIPIDDSGAPIRDVTGELRGVVLVFRDFTAYKSAERKLRDALDELDAANTAKNQFFARLSHELRTPLTPVLATLSLWEGHDELPEQMRSDVQMMRRNVELETRLIDELLDVSRIMRGTVSLKPERTDAHELISSVLKMYSSEIYSHGLAMITDLAAQQHYVNVDRGRVQQVFWNILKNAATHTSSGGRIIIRSFNDGPNICISFRDTGIGMSSETIQMLFKPFEGRNRENSNGLGLGLSISRALIVQQGGDITASSEGSGLGSEFRVTLPTVGPPADETLTVPLVVTKPAMARRRMRILLVEDHSDSATVMARGLSQLGYQVDIAGTVSAAVDLFQNEQYDLVLSDLGLPDGSGMDLLRKLREIREVPAIALTGYGMEEDIVQTQSLGFLRHLTKPVSYQNLQDALDQLPGA
jgi:PAS domain S-box-containing protein